MRIILIIPKVKKLIQCKIFHIQFNYFSGSFQICKEAMHIDSLRVNGMSAKMFISVAGCPQIGCLVQIRIDCRDSTDVLQEIQSIYHVLNTSKYMYLVHWKQKFIYKIVI